MKISDTNNVYSVVLTDQEWYGMGLIGQDLLRADVQINAREADCQYISIIVEPDAVLSISPIEGRHQVWRYSFEPEAERRFKEALTDLLAAHKDVSWKRMAAILKSYSEG